MKNNESYLAIQSKFKYFVFLCIYFVLYPLAKLFYGSKKHWLICDRRDDAQDNGYFFFKYLIKEHPYIKATFIVNKTSPKYTELSKVGNVVKFCSFKHFFMAIGSRVKISSQIFGYAPWVTMATYFRRNETRDIHVFLQHGIIKNLHPNLFGNVCKSLNLFVCGAKPEYEFIKKDFCYQNEAPQYTGLARYDNLTNFETRNYLLIMPTWRMKLTGIDKNGFLNSNFFREWNALINDPQLLNICKKNNLKIRFYLHHELQTYSDCFDSNDVVEIIKSEVYCVQDLLKEAKLLITDFSSVYFDFAYMKKPEIYFQFDESTFYDTHYQQGYFDYRKDGFGPVCLTKNDVIIEVKKCNDNNFVLEKEYEYKIDKNFVYRDTHNCDRIYEQILRIINNG